MADDFGVQGMLDERIGPEEMEILEVIYMEYSKGERMPELTSLVEDLIMLSRKNPLFKEIRKDLYRRLYRFRQKGVIAKEIKFQRTQFIILLSKAFIKTYNAVPDLNLNNRFNVAPTNSDVDMVMNKLLVSEKNLLTKCASEECTMSDELLLKIVPENKLKQVKKRLANGYMDSYRDFFNDPNRKDSYNNNYDESTLARFVATLLKMSLWHKKGFQLNLEYLTSDMKVK